MIKKLQQKFISIAMISLFFVMIFIVGVINSVMLYEVNQHANVLLSILSDNDGDFPQNEVMLNQDKSWISKVVVSAETRFETRYFSVFFKNDGTLRIDTDNIAAISPENAQIFAKDIMENGKKTGYSGTYKYLVSQKEDGTLVVFVDCNLQKQTQENVLIISGAIGCLSLLIMFILVSVFSKKAIEPMIENMEKQKQFITDASHEIKTPLAIISANTDVLELSIGKSQWLDSTRNQTVRLNSLVKDLLTLSRMEENSEETIFTNFSISNTVQEIAAPFIAIATTQNKKFELQVEGNLSLRGDQHGVEKLVSILVDNAIKYTNDQGTIQVILKKQGRNIKLEVCNTCEQSQNLEKDLDRLFDRFYRRDSSRARETGGYGIGLSIAQAIVKSHKGKIRAYITKEEMICFSVLL